jgi:hypothetical protein
MSTERFVGAVLLAVSEALDPLQQAVASPDDLAALLADLGFGLDPAAVTSPLQPAFGSLPADTQTLAQAAQQLAALAPDADEVAVALAVASVAAAIGLVVADVHALATTSPSGTLPAPLNDPAFWSAIATDLLQYLVYVYLERHQTALFGILRFLGVAALEPQAATATRAAYDRRTMRFDRLLEAVENPEGLMADVYGWGGTFAHDSFVENLGSMFAGLGAPALVTRPPDAALDLYYDAGAAPRETVLEVSLPLYWAVVQAGGVMGYASFALILVPIPPNDSRTADPAGFAITPDVIGSLSQSIQLTAALQLQVSGGLESVGAIALELRPGHTSVTFSPTLGLTLNASAKLDAQPPAPWVLLGSAGSTRLELAHAHASLGVKGPVAALEVLLAAGADSAAFVVDFGDGDGFLQHFFGGNPQQFDLALGLAWSSRTGFSFSGSAGLQTTLSEHKSIGGVVDIDTLSVGLLAAAAQGSLDLELAASGSVHLGPITAAIDRVGIGGSLRSVAAGAPAGNLGALDLSWAFKPPSGIGLKIDASAVTGGGALIFDTQRQEYAGVLDLEVAKLLSVKVIVVLSTQGGGFSLIGLVFVDGFTPIEIGFGFTLNGVGGMVAINRTAAVEVLRAGMKSSELDTLLFPADPVANVRQIITDLDSAFPRADGRYLFGPMAEIGWGEPTLVTIKVGILLELPSPVRLILLGLLEALLPSKDAPIVKLHIDAIGVIDFDRGDLALDAVLYDSQVLTYALTGGMALRASWGANRTLVLAVGGLHPRFQPPPGFPTLDRVAIALGVGDNPRLRLEAYLAVTSNTVQLGAHLDLHAAAGGFALDGHLGFDTLIHFDPFAFLAELAADLALSFNGQVILSVGLDMSLSGPSPWHAWGKATFQILFFQASVGFDVTFGQALPPAPVAVPQVEQKLLAALGEPRNWSSVLPPAEHPPVRLLPVTQQSPGVLAHPLGQLTVHQREVPLELAMSRFGTVPLPAPLTFHIDPSSVQLGGRAASPAPVPVSDFFAPGQFRNLTDDERLSRPSFESYQSGLQFGLANHVAAFPTGSGIGYATVVVDPLAPAPPAAAGATPLPAAGGATQPAAGGATPPAAASATPLATASATPPATASAPPPAPDYQVPDAALAAQVPSGAAARAPLNTVGTAKFAAPARPVAVAPATFTVASTDDLKPPGAAAAFGTFSQTADALQQIVAQHPELQGKVQVVARQEHRRPDLPPLTSLTVGTPSVAQSAQTWVGPGTRIALGPRPGISLRSLSFRVRPPDAPPYVTPSALTASIALPAADGTYQVDWFGIDTADNEEDQQTAVLVLDGTPPRSTLALAPQVPNVGMPATVTAVDSGAGVASVSYRIYAQGSAAPTYTTVTGATAGFTISGPDGTYQVDYFATDLVGNAEPARSQLLPLDDTPPQSTLVIGAPGYPLDAPQFVTAASRLTITATDHGSGVRSVSYRVFARGGTAPAYVTTPGSRVSVPVSGSDGVYEVDFYATDNVGNVEAPHTASLTLDNTPPQSTLGVGTPSFPAVNPGFVTGATPLTISAVDAGAGVASVSYRAYAQGSAPPSYTVVTGSSATLHLSGPDGAYQVDLFATDNLGNAEAAHSAVLTLDGTPPTVAIGQPAASTYPHGSTLTLDYSAGDGAGAGVESVTATMDGAATVGGHGLASGQAIDLSAELGPGSHTFVVTAADNVGNTSSTPVQFTVGS